MYTAAQYLYSGPIFGVDTVEAYGRFDVRSAGGESILVVPIQMKNVRI